MQGGEGVPAPPCSPPGLPPRSELGGSGRHLPLLGGAGLVSPSWQAFSQEGRQRSEARGRVEKKKKKKKGQKKKANSN